MEPRSLVAYTCLASLQGQRTLVLASVSSTSHTGLPLGSCQNSICPFPSPTKSKFASPIHFPEYFSSLAPVSPFAVIRGDKNGSWPQDAQTLAVASLALLSRQELTLPGLTMQTWPGQQGLVELPENLIRAAGR